MASISKYGSPVAARFEEEPAKLTPHYDRRDKKISASDNLKRAGRYPTGKLKWEDGFEDDYDFDGGGGGGGGAFSRYGGRLKDPNGLGGRGGGGGGGGVGAGGREGKPKVDHRDLLLPPLEMRKHKQRASNGSSSMEDSLVFLDKSDTTCAETKSLSESSLTLRVTLLDESMSGSSFASSSQVAAAAAGKGRAAGRGQETGCKPRAGPDSFHSRSLSSNSSINSSRFQSDAVSVASNFSARTRDRPLRPPEPSYRQHDCDDHTRRSDDDYEDDDDHHDRFSKDVDCDTGGGVGAGGRRDRHRNGLLPRMDTPSSSTGEWHTFCSQKTLKIGTVATTPVARRGGGRYPDDLRHQHGRYSSAAPPSRGERGTYHEDSRSINRAVAGRFEAFDEEEEEDLEDEDVEDERSYYSYRREDEKGRRYGRRGDQRYYDDRDRDRPRNRRWKEDYDDDGYHDERRGRRGYYDEETPFMRDPRDRHYERDGRNADPYRHRSSARASRDRYYQDYQNDPRDLYRDSYSNSENPYYHRREEQPSRARSGAGFDRMDRHRPLRTFDEAEESEEDLHSRDDGSLYRQTSRAGPYGNDHTVQDGLGGRDHRLQDRNGLEGKDGRKDRARLQDCNKMPGAFFVSTKDLREAERSKAATRSFGEATATARPSVAGSGGDQEPIFIEVFPGVTERLRRSKETIEAVGKDFYAPAACTLCNMDVFCVADVRYFICPECKCICPLDDESFEGAAIKRNGVGIAFGFETLFKMQSEIVGGRR